MKLIDLFGSNQATKQSEFGTAATPTISGNTGIDAADSLLDWIGRGADVYRDIKGASSVVPPNTPSGTTPGTKPTGTQNMESALKGKLLWIGVGAALLIGIFIYSRR